MQTTQAPSQELHTPNPTALYPVSLLLLKLMHTVIALFPTHHCLLMMEWVQCLLSLPLPHPCLLLLMPPWRIMIHPHWTRKFQMDSRRTWIETMTNQRAIKPSQLCKKYSNLSLDMVMASATVVLVSILDFWILFFFFLFSWRRQTRKVWGTGHYRIHSWAGHGPWQLQRNKVQYWGLGILSSRKMPGYMLAFIREGIISNYSSELAPAAFYVK